MNLEKIKACAKAVGKQAWKYRTAIFGTCASLLVRLIPLPSSIDDEIKGHIYKSLGAIITATFNIITCEGPLTDRSKASLLTSVGTGIVLVTMLAIGTPAAAIGATMSTIGIALLMYRLHGFLETLKSTPAVV